MFKIVFFLLRLAVVAGLFLLLFRPETFGLAEDRFGNLSLQSVIEPLRNVEAGSVIFWLTVASVFKLSGIFCGIIRWRILLRGQGIHIPFWYLTKCWFWGRAIGLFLPGTVGLDGYRLVESAHHTGEVIKCTTVIAVEKLTGFIALFTLVFLTLPLGLRIYQVNLVLLAAVLAALGIFIAVSLTLLMQPRIIQVLAAVLPVPRAVRHQVNKLGLAATAYGSNRMALIKALIFGLGVHMGICMMYFGTASAVRPDGTSILDILFVSPLIIVGSVFAPTVSGAGVREVGMTSLLGNRIGMENAFLSGHLGLWIGEAVPFLLSLPLLLFTGRPNREALLAEIEEVRKAAPYADADDLHMTEEEIADYRAKVFSSVAAGVLGGALAGTLVGLFEGVWIARTLSGLAEYGLFGWGPAVYAVCLGAIGVGVTGALLFLYLLTNRFPSAAVTYALSFAGTFTAGGAVIALFRFKRDVLGAHAPTMVQNLQVLGLVAGAALLGLVVCYLLAAGSGRYGARVRLLGGAGICAAIMALGGLVALVARPGASAAAFAPQAASSGPNIILVAIDTLRADYLKLYRGQALAETPALETFAKDAIVFEKGFSQASWTKPSFGTMFSGLYPEQHRATTKTAPLPDEVETVAELLQAGGYYTKGVANNPNVGVIFNFQQGFVEYDDLKPRLYFGATPSASKLALYEVVRRVRQMASQKLRFLPGVGRIVVTDFYQPGEVITRFGLDWLDAKRVPEGAPFFLYLHYMDPHDPFMDPASPEGGYARVRMENPDPDVYKEALRNAYNLEIEHLDRQLGALFDGLKQRGLYDDALIVLTSDHGEEFYDHRGWWHGKTLYEEQTHVPYIIKQPGNRNGGLRSPFIARHVDIAPTMLAFAGLPRPARMPGQPLFNEEGALSHSNILFSYSENDFEGNVLQAVRSMECKVITANEGNPRGLAPVEVYDLLRDPGELANVAGEAACESPLHAVLGEYQKVIRENAAEPGAAVDITEDREQLESLGYLN